MFVDLVKIYVNGGDGGRGSNAMRREKYVPHGGPFGGDGGRGGDVVFVVDGGLRTLLDFKHQRHLKADRGEHGKGKGMSGRTGPDFEARVPPGTIIRDADTGVLLFDLVESGQRAVVARGGRGGRGNMHFASSIHQAPTMYEEGEPGEERWLLLELKVVADVGLIGFPNAGKSTLLGQVSAAKAKVGDYPFTTLHPNLGVVEVDGYSFVVADIPGLIEGAHQGTGLGHKFLRHIERCRILVHVLDGVVTDGREVLDGFDIINAELKMYSPKLAGKPQLVAFNKVDVPQAAEVLPIVMSALAARGIQVFPISAATGRGVEKLLYAVAGMLKSRLKDEPPVGALPAEADEKVYRATDPRHFMIVRNQHCWVVRGQYIERLVAMTPKDNEEAAERLQRILRRSGIEQALRRAGARDGDTVEIGGVQFELSGNQSGGRGGRFPSES